MSPEEGKRILIDRWVEVDDLVRRSLSVPPQARESFLQEACGHDQELHRYVSRLLEKEPTADRQFESSSPPLEALREPEGPEQAPMVGQDVGPYRILSRIGHGGAGSVYLAERVDGTFHRRVALKLLHTVAASPRAVSRFRAERQILAQLEHPSICRLIGGGELPNGQPYLVMEFVEGEPITSYCDQHRLGIQERIDLFLQVCDAVQYAHRNLVVHRDLKPGNILVTSRGRVKLLDFGIAKMLEPDPETGAHLLTTQQGESPMTPAYASPEQLRGLQVTTATDTYALGVLLYRLLTGRLPFQVQDRSPGELERLISTVDPERPSSAAMKRRRHEAGTQAIPWMDAGWARRLRGDLDTIILKTLRKDPARRYPSVTALAQDLERFGEGRPVLARPTGFGYRAGKFMRRRPGVVAAILTAIMVLGGYGALLTVHAERLQSERDIARAEAQRADQERVRAEAEQTRAEAEAERAVQAQLMAEESRTQAEEAQIEAESARDRLEVEAARAEQVTRFLVDLFDAADPTAGQPEQVTVHDLLEEGVRRVDELGRQPDVQAELALTMSRVHHALGLFPEALELADRALATLPASEGPSLQRAEIQLRRGSTLHQLGSFSEAEDLFRSVVEIRRDSLGADHPQLAAGLQHLGAVLRSQGRLSEAEPLYREVLAIQRSALGERDPAVAESLSNLALLLRDQGDLEGSEPLLRRALDAQLELLGDEHVTVARTRSNLALVLRSMDRYQEARPLYERSLETLRAVLGEDHPDVATVLNNLGLLLRYQEEYELAEDLTRQALRIRRSLFGNEHPEVARTVNNLGIVLRAGGDLDGAEEMYRESLRIRRAVYGSEHPAVATALTNLGFLRGLRGDHPASEELYREALELRRQIFGEEHPAVARSVLNLGVSLREQGSFDEAESLLTRALSLQRRLMGDEHPRVASALEHLATLYRQVGRDHDAEALLQEALGVRVAALGEGHPDVRSTREQLAELSERHDR